MSVFSFFFAFELPCDASVVFFFFFSLDLSTAAGVFCLDVQIALSLADYLYGWLLINHL